MIQWIAFVVASLLLIVISWKPLHHPGTHGFYRFFAWEAILTLFVINAPFWLYKPFAWNQIVAWSLLFLSLIPLIFGVHSLRTRGKPDQHREGDTALLAFEKTTVLVTGGVYRYIRHPLYSSLLLLTWGIFFKAPSAFGIVLALTVTFFLLATARADEIECAHFFGAPYRAYMKMTKRFIPYLFQL